jgi:cytochrome c-type biogenesis protein CcmH
MIMRSAARFSGWRAALDPARAQRVARHVSVCCLVAALGMAAVLVAAALDDPSAIDRIQDQASPGVSAASELDPGTAALAARLERAPGDVDGWSLLARAYVTRGDAAAAADASLRVAALRAGDPDELARHAETRIAEAGGIVDPAARRLIEATLALDPADVRARFLLGLAQGQAGQTREALETWFALDADSPRAAPWLGALHATIDALVAAAEIDPATLAAARGAVAVHHASAEPGR